MPGRKGIGTLIACALASGFLGYASSAAADSAAAGTDPGIRFPDADSNRDRALDRAEFKKVTEALIRRLDTDRNGELSKAEFDRIVDLTGRFEEFDLNRNGVLEPAELEKLDEHLFQVLDEDNDQRIDAQEFRRIEKLLRPPG
jgi:Ca2+-binding EF-hand superfamily protein